MLTTRVLHSALLLSLASAGLAFAQGAFAQGEVAPVAPNAASENDPGGEPRVPSAQAQDASNFWQLICLRLSPFAHVWQRPSASRPLPQPFPPQSEKELAYIDQLLTSWEDHSGKIERYRADFSRWVTDPVFGPSETFKTFSKGEILYEAPDKGLFHVDSTGQWMPPFDAGGRPTYPDMGDSGKEQWIYDGKSLFEFNYAQKKLVERQVPPRMPDDEIAFGPLLFVLGAGKKTILSRYWIRVTTTKDAQERGEYWLEAYPKFGDDAVNYTKIEIIIAGSDFFTSAIKICERNDVETIYQFTTRSANWDLDSAAAGAGRSAFTPATPPGWERMVERAPGAAAAR